MQLHLQAVVTALFLPSLFPFFLQLFFQKGLNTNKPCNMFWASELRSFSSRTLTCTTERFQSTWAALPARNRALWFWVVLLLHLPLKKPRPHNAWKNRRLLIERYATQYYISYSFTPLFFVYKCLQSQRIEVKQAILLRFPREKKMEKSGRRSGWKKAN